VEVAAPLDVFVVLLVFIFASVASVFFYWAGHPAASAVSHFATALLGYIGGAMRGLVVPYRQEEKK